MLSPSAKEYTGGIMSVKALIFFACLFILLWERASNLREQHIFGSSSVQEPVTFTSDVEQRKQRNKNNTA